MNILKNKIKNIKPAVIEQVNYSSVNVVYKLPNGMWRGFVRPYDVTYEAEDKNIVIKVLREMVSQYEESLKRYNNPEHLSSVPLTEKEDIEKYNTIEMDLMNSLHRKNGKIISKDYYAEAKLPA